MNPNELANSGIVTQLAVVHTMLPKVKELIDNQIAEIEALKARIERMVEDRSKYEAQAHAGGFEEGRKLGMKQERALWELAASTQEIMK